MHRDRSSDHPGKFDPSLVDPLVRMIAPLCRRMWPGTLHHLDRLPDHDRFMVVANHSGMGTAELWSLLVEWHRRFGGSRPVAGMAHPGAFRTPLLADILHGLGAVEATREGAAKARRAGVPLLLFPGGDYEASRPLWQARRVDFAGRKGWIRLGREHGLTIVPLCIKGSHRTVPILLRGRRSLAWIMGTRLIGVHRSPLTVLSFIAALTTFGLARSAGVGPIGSAAATWASIWATMMIPWVPSSIDFHFLPSIAPDEFVDPARDDELYKRVVGSLQAAMTALT